MERSRIWTRVGHWFSGASRNAGGDGLRISGDGVATSKPAAIAGQVGSPVEVLATQVVGAEQDGERPASREQAIVELVDSMQQRLEDQTQWMERVAATLERTAGNLDGLVAGSQSQLELLGRIDDRLLQESEATRRIEESLSQFPALADAQRETMVAVSRQLDQMSERHEQDAGKFVEVQESLARVADNSETATDTLKGIGIDAAQRDEHMAALVEAQTRRITMIGAAAVSTAGLAVILALVALLG